MSLLTLFYIISFSLFAQIFWATLLPVTMIQLRYSKAKIIFINIIIEMAWLTYSAYLWCTDFVIPFVYSETTPLQITTWKMTAAIVVVFYATTNLIFLWQEYKTKKGG